MILATQIPIVTERLKAALERGCYQGSAAVNLPSADLEPMRLLVERLERFGYVVTVTRAVA